MCVSSFFFAYRLLCVRTFTRLCLPSEVDRKIKTMIYLSALSSPSSSESVSVRWECFACVCVFFTLECSSVTDGPKTCVFAQPGRRGREKGNKVNTGSDRRGQNKADGQRGGWQ